MINVKKYLIFIGIGTVSAAIWTKVLLDMTNKKYDLSDISVDQLENDDKE
jgi:hypothetical protein|nr:MAG TPA: hypothetical protein [Caudoviricetes sp.]